jgi:DnaK suppressor protein
VDDPRQRLAAERADTLARVAALQHDVGVIVGAASSTTGDDEHDPEGSTIGFERAQAQALLDQASAHLAEIDAALARVGEGTYGTCTRCGRPIAPERLDARPEAALCITCAARHS